jgi:hypothetical protein
MALRDRAPESDFREFSDTETKRDEGNIEMSRHFVRFGTR